MALEPPNASELTLYERVGGDVFFVDLVERFYAGVENDPVLRPLYPPDLEPGKANLAAFLAQYHQKRTLLIDQQQMLGNACVYLGLDGEHHTLGEFVRNLKRMDNELLHGFVAHHFSGLDVLSSPDVSSSQEPVSAQEFARALEFLRGEYDYIILDCDRRQPDLWPGLATTSSEILMVTTPEVAAVRDLSRIADGLVVTEGTSSKLKVILNRYNAPHAVAADQIEKVLKLPIALKLQDSPGEMVFASNSGKTLKFPGPSQLAVGLHGWSSKLADVTTKPAPKRKEENIFIVLFFF